MLSNGGDACANNALKLRATGSWPKLWHPRPLPHHHLAPSLIYLLTSRQQPMHKPCPN